MKKSFIAGLIILLPLALTLMLIRFAVRLLSKPFLGMSESLLQHLGVAKRGFSFLSDEQLLYYLSTFFSLIAFFAFLLLLGWAARSFFFHTFIRYTDKLFHNIPLVNKIYKACQDVIRTIFSATGQAFGRVVLVPYPYEGVYAFGMVTQETDLELKASRTKKIAVFIPATPNPTMGFILQYDPEQIVEVNMTMEQMLHCLISCGSIIPEFGKREA